MSDQVPEKIDSNEAKEEKKEEVEEKEEIEDQKEEKKDKKVSLGGNKNEKNYRFNGSCSGCINISILW